VLEFQVFDGSLNSFNGVPAAFSCVSVSESVDDVGFSVFSDDSQQSGDLFSENLKLTINLLLS